MLRVNVEISCYLSDGKIDRITRFITYVCAAERQLGKVLPFKNLGGGGGGESYTINRPTILSVINKAA